jgi:hypothetical protein
MVGWAEQQRSPGPRHHREGARQHVRRSVKGHLRWSVHISMRLGRTRGRKRILVSHWSELTPPRRPRPGTALVKALAVPGAGSGCPTGRVRLGERHRRGRGISKSYVSRVLRLAPDIVEAILAGTMGRRSGSSSWKAGVPSS